MSDPSLYINPFHFIARMSMVPSFYRSLKCSDQTFKAHSVARFIVGRHFDTMCTCSQLRAATSITTPMAHDPSDCMLAFARGEQECISRASCMLMCTSAIAVSIHTSETLRKSWKK